MLLTWFSKSIYRITNLMLRNFVNEDEDIKFQVNVNNVVIRITPNPEVISDAILWVLFGSDKVHLTPSFPGKLYSNAIVQLDVKNKKGDQHSFCRSWNPERKKEIVMIDMNSYHDIEEGNKAIYEMIAMDIDTFRRYHLMEHHQFPSDEKEQKKTLKEFIESQYSAQTSQILFNFKILDIYRGHFVLPPTAHRSDLLKMKRYVTHPSQQILSLVSNIVDDDLHVIELGLQKI